jgi:hypothetical protein
MVVQIQIRRGTAAEWTSANPLLAEGELGAELDTGQFKIGNGTDNWADLEYATQQGIQGIQGIQGDPGADGADGADGAPGADGASAYDIAVADGFVGDETAWLASLVGADGADGADGAPGATGPKGDKGDTGATGATGAAGTNGTNGTNGQGVPTGGTADQYLKKVSSTDYDTAWATFPVVREVLAANRTYYVRTDGSDSNNGLANTSGGAFLTLQKAIDITAALDISIYDVTINVAAGTYTGAVTVNGGWIGSGTVSLVGDTTTPSNVILSGTGTRITVQNQGSLRVRGFKMSTTTSGWCLAAMSNSILTVDGAMEFGACAWAHLYAIYYGVLNVTSNYTINGNAQDHCRAENGGIVKIQSLTITLTGTPAFSSTFARTFTMGMVIGNSSTFSGSATGKRYQSNQNALIHSGAGGANYFPGDVAGEINSSGVYV